ncbi:divergent polysaccharide deacetylase family protein [Marinicellulosiphila megalodicopiae]|uniref:divergent polysaccharide deacetylase family protein n=1 Tax=Marinicellulosiphila megalodicopiae TaxID=2724896 RepID=UPI003BB1CB51
MNVLTLKNLSCLLFLFFHFNFANSASTQSSHEFSKPKIAVVIDDLGNQYDFGEQIINQSIIKTVAVMPLRAYTFSLSKLAYENKKEIIIHMPMDNNGRFPMGKLGLSVDYDKQETFYTLEMAFAENPYATGLNNHTGSFYTEQYDQMGWVMEYLKLNNMFFLDSRTSAKSQGVIQSKEKKLPWAGRHVFLDNKKDFDSLNKQWLKALSLANKNQKVIIIGHPYPETIAFFKQLNHSDLEMHFEFVKVSDLLERNFQQ